MTRHGETPLDGADLVLADLDGVVYRGRLAIPHAVESLNQVAESIPVGYLTNNASRTVDTVAAQLRAFGLRVRPAEIVSSPQAAVRLLSGLVAPESLIFVLGGEGLVEELHKAGYPVTRSADDGPAALVQGFSPDIGWRDLAEAAFALQFAQRTNPAGIPWVATNTDWTLPVERGIAPGAGTLVSAVHSAVGRLPVVAGKPEAAIFDEARSRFGASSPLFIGDRLDTDILGANRAGMAAAMVLTGVDGAKQLLAANAESRPRYILEDLRGLHHRYPDTGFSRDRGTATVGRSAVRITANAVEIAREGEGGIDLLRAACAAIWASGKQIYALTVPERLFE